MIESKTNWELVDQPTEKECASLKEEIGSSSLFAALCIQRNLKTKEEVVHFLHPDETWYHDPFTLGDMEKAVERIRSAIAAKEKITVYGDYDADGVTSTAILVETLKKMGADVEFFIPNRFQHGYGPNKEAFKEIIVSGTQLILTCDNGISGHEALLFAKEENIDVIVTDHHELPETLPPAYAYVHPRLPGSAYAFSDLSGAGVAFKTAWALLGEKPIELVELAAIGTIADLVSLSDENRMIAKEGLERMKETERAGLKALYKACDIQPNTIDGDTIGFSIGPRLNAAGRLGEATPAVDLLLEEDAEKAKHLSEYLVQLNDERKRLVERITEEAMAKDRLSDNALIHILASPDWHEGVLGIVASRIVQETGKPAIVMNIDRETGLAKGSGRSIETINLFDAITQVKHLTTQFGGHHMAAGLTLPSENLSLFEEQLNEWLEAHHTEDQLKQATKIHLVQPPESFTLQAIEEMNLLAPFGTDNEKPVFLMKEVDLKSVRQIGSNSQHVKLTIGQNGCVMDAVGFNMPEIDQKTGAGAMVSVVGTAEINEWRGRKKPQFMLKDIRTEGTQYFDFRGRSKTRELLKKDSIDFVFFKKESFERWSEKIPAESNVLFVEEDIFHGTPRFNQAVLFDCPPSREILADFFSMTEYGDLYFHFLSTEEAYLSGLPDRNEFGRLYKYILSHPSMDLKNKTDLLANHLRLDISKLNFMISVFFEAGFVTIEDGLVTPVENPEKVNLTNTNVYKQRKEFIYTQELLQYSSLSQLIEVVEKWSLSMPVA